MSVHDVVNRGRGAGKGWQFQVMRDDSLSWTQTRLLTAQERQAAVEFLAHHPERGSPAELKKEVKAVVAALAVDDDMNHSPPAELPSGLVPSIGHRLASLSSTEEAEDDDTSSARSLNKEVVEAGVNSMGVAHHAQEGSLDSGDTNINIETNANMNASTSTNTNTDLDEELLSSEGGWSGHIPEPISVHPSSSSDRNTVEAPAPQTPSFYPQLPGVFVDSPPEVPKTRRWAHPHDLATVNLHETSSSPGQHNQDDNAAGVRGEHGGKRDANTHHTPSLPYGTPVSWGRTSNPSLIPTGFGTRYTEASSSPTLVDTSTQSGTSPAGQAQPSFARPNKAFVPTSTSTTDIQVPPPSPTRADAPSRSRDRSRDRSRACARPSRIVDPGSVRVSSPTNLDFSFDFPYLDSPGVQSRPKPQPRPQLQPPSHLQSQRDTKKSKPKEYNTDINFFSSGYIGTKSGRARSDPRRFRS